MRAYVNAHTHIYIYIYTWIFQGVLFSRRLGFDMLFWADSQKEAALRKSDTNKVKTGTNPEKVVEASGLWIQ